MPFGSVGFPTAESQTKAHACGPGPHRAGRVFRGCWKKNGKPQRLCRRLLLSRISTALFGLRENTPPPRHRTCPAGSFVYSLLGNVEVIWLADWKRTYHNDGSYSVIARAIITQDCCLKVHPQGKPPLPLSGNESENLEEFKDFLQVI